LIDKVDGPSALRGVATTREIRRPARTGGTGFVKHLGAPLENGGVSSLAALGTISPVMGLQEIDDALARSKRGKHRAQSILDQLEEIRLELLLGGLSQGRLMQLSRMVTTRRPDIEDPRLAEILDEIDLRAQVELAKMGY
jgi:hypothetical protein